jgi:tetratricopeptide (TPR) repeat protein
MRGVCDAREHPEAATLRPGDAVYAAVEDLDLLGGRIILSLDHDDVERQITGVYLGLMPHVEPIAQGQPARQALAPDPVWLNPNNLDVLRARWIDLPNGSLLTAFHGIDYDQRERYRAARRSQDAARAMESVEAGVQHHSAGRVKEAFREYNLALEFDRECAEALVGRGALHTKQGSFTKGVADLERAIQIEPAHRNATNYLEKTLIMKSAALESSNKVHDAVAELARAVKLNGPKRAECLATLNRIEHQLEQKAAVSRNLQASASAAFGGVLNLTSAKPKGSATGLSVRERDTLITMRELLARPSASSSAASSSSPASASSANKRKRDRKEKREKKSKSKKKKSKRKSGSSSSSRKQTYVSDEGSSD